MDAFDRIMELSRQGLYCAQIMVQLALDAEGRENPELVQAMMQVIRNGGFGNGGTNFDAKTRRNSTDLEDIFIAHISGMDAMARALECAARLLEESPYKKMLAERYASFDSGKGKDFEEGRMTLEDVVAYAKTVGEPRQTSGKQELYERIVSMYC